VHKKIATILRNIGNLECIEKAKILEEDTYQSRTLNLRSLNLKPNDMIAISDILKQEKETHSDFITSISFSYNTLIGDAGATILARSLPLSLCKIGLVDCGIGDKGGSAILNWMKNTAHLQMVCIEQNCFSVKLKMEFKIFRKNNPKITVVV
jgi:hypothetical protein